MSTSTAVSTFVLPQQCGVIVIHWIYMLLDSILSRNASSSPRPNEIPINASILDGVVLYTGKYAATPQESFVFALIWFGISTAILLYSMRRNARALFILALHALLAGTPFAPYVDSISLFFVARELLSQTKIVGLRYWSVATSYLIIAVYVLVWWVNVDLLEHFIALPVRYYNTPFSSHWVAIFACHFVHVGQTHLTTVLASLLNRGNIRIKAVHFLLLALFTTIGLYLTLWMAYHYRAALYYYLEKQESTSCHSESFDNAERFLRVTEIIFGGPKVIICGFTSILFAISGFRDGFRFSSIVYLITPLLIMKDGKLVSFIGHIVGFSIGFLYRLVFLSLFYVNKNYTEPLFQKCLTTVEENNEKASGKRFELFHL